MSAATAPTACPCGREQAYEDCCAPMHEGKVKATTAEDLLRSRYCAFVKHEIDYLIETAHPDTQKELKREEIEEWATQSEWKGLFVGNMAAGGPDDDEAAIEFVANYVNEKGEEVNHHERSYFQRVDGDWRFVDGEPAKPEPVRREEPKIGRNDPCTCGSGKKYKKCCGKAA